MNITLVCEESFDGIMTAVYDGWVLMNQGHQVAIHPGMNYAPTFFSKFVQVHTNIDKAARVAESIRIKISVEAFVMVFKACMHYDTDRADVVFNFLRLAYPAGAKVTKMLGNPYVMKLMELSRKVSNEAHFLKEFIRFEELRGNVLYGKIEPKCDVLSMVSEHFTARFPQEDWIIYDIKRKKAEIHQHGAACIMVEGKDIEKITKKFQTSDEYSKLWKIFFHTIGIEQRYNPKCQQNNMPKWYRKYMTEFEN